MAELTLNYSIVDVFTRTRFNGNPVAVIHDGGELNSDQMQSIAREFGFSETTFILPPNDSTATAQVRIFTPFDEIPFAGHPNIGTSFVIATKLTAALEPLPKELVLNELGGDVRVRLLYDQQTVSGAEIEAPQTLQIMGAVNPELMARCLGLEPEDINAETIAPCVASVGLPFAFVELEDLNALSSVTPDIAAFREAEQQGPNTVDGFAVCAFVIMKDKGKSVELRTRVFSPLGHPLEDPATGSASGALAKLLSAAFERNDVIYKIIQGVEMGRPSNIIVRTTETHLPPLIQGSCVMVSEGTLWV